MRKDQPSIDGFVPRRPRSQLGELQNQKHPERHIKPIDRALHSGSKPTVINQVGVPRQGYNVGEAAREYDNLNRGDISESLSSIDDDDLSRRDKKRRRKAARYESKINRPHKRRKRIILIIVLVLVAALLAVGGFFAYKLTRASGNVLQGSIFDLVQNQPLKVDANGRSNFLILGTSEDDPGHQGSNLTDSMLIVSVDQNNKNAYMFSVPRDLYVSYGQACPAGYAGKINAYFSCINDGKTPDQEQARLAAEQKFVGDIFGIDIQYGVHVNYTVVRDTINAIGGSITVDVQGDGNTPAGIPAGSVMDGNFDWKCGATAALKLKNCPPRGHFIDYGPGPQEMDAEHALYFAQARGDNGITWGLAQSNFDREKNQQKVLVAIKDKATSAGTLTNLGAVTGLIDALGNNLRTNVQTSEVRTLMSLGTSIPSDSIKSISLIDAQPQLLSTGSPIAGAGSIVYPTAGIGNYDDLQAFIAKSISSDPIVSEAANITVLNGSGVAGVAQTTADQLTAKHYTVDEVSDAPDGTYAPYTIYQISSDKPETAKALAALYGVQVTTTKPPVSVTGNTDFVIIVGPKSSTGTSN